MREPTNDASQGELILYQTQDRRTRIECGFEDETIYAQVNPHWAE